MDTTRGERSSEEWPISVHETQRPNDGDFASDLTHNSHLLLNTIDELGAVTTTDDELVDTWPEDAAFDLEPRATLVALGIDDPDPRGSDDDVVDIGATARDETVMKNGKGVRCAAIQTCTEPFLADGARGPGFRALPLVGKSDGHATEPAPLLTQSLLILGLAPLIFTTSRCAGAGERGIWRRLTYTRGWIGDGDVTLSPRTRPGFRRTAVHATDGPCGLFVDRLSTSSQLSSAQSALAGIAQTHSLLCRLGRP